MRQGFEGCYLTRVSQIKLSTGRLQAKVWIKYLGNDTFLLWDTTSSLKIKLLCNIDKLMKIPCGSLVEIRGFVNEYGICVERVEVIHIPLHEELACIEDVPSDPLEYTLRYPIFIRHPKIARSILTYSIIVNSIRNLLLRSGFIELPTVIVGYASDPGLRGASKISIRLYDNVFELQSSLIMYKQLYASVFDKVFYVAKNIRDEPVENIHTGRHLVEFTQVDIEAANKNASEMISFAEKIFYNAVKRILSKYSDLLDYKEIELIEREITKPPYPRLPYDDAINEALKLGFKVSRNTELSFEAEIAIANRFNSPVWITGFPIDTRGFYYVESRDRPGYNEDYNLLLPRHGEVLDGGCREHRYEILVNKIAKIHKEPIEKYKWFLELAKAGLIRPTCGWGLGVERLIKYIYNLEHVAYATPHPRIPGVIGP
ncbi:MAG: asparagine synthetase A [Desulfurococcaceae archaeon]